MQMDQQQLWALDKLGITVWQQREAEIPHSAPESEFSSPSADDNLIFDCPLLLSVPSKLAPAEQQLLNNICKALDLPAAVLQVCPDSDLPKVVIANNQPAQILCFGGGESGLTAVVRERCQTLPSLTEILRRPALKSDVWSALLTIQSTLR